MQVEVELEYPVPAGTAQHSCWKQGTVMATRLIDGKPCAEVHLRVVGMLMLDQAVAGDFGCADSAGT
jgi:hypothetical protein